MPVEGMPVEGSGTTRRTRLLKRSEAWREGLHGSEAQEYIRRRARKKSVDWDCSVELTCRDARAQGKDAQERKDRQSFARHRGE